jgi:transglutaminase-like putative cysteine protease
MRYSLTPLRNLEETVNAMYAIIAQYSSDVAMYASWSPERFYNFVRDIPYRADPKGNEHLQRPAVTINSWSPWNDCDDLAILMCSYAKEAGIPYRLAVGGSHAYINRRNGARVVPFHHVWPEFQFRGVWTPMDATYPRYSPYVHNQRYLKIKVFTLKTR